jgi:hypothetical protein
MTFDACMNAPIYAEAAHNAAASPMIAKGPANTLDCCSSRMALTRMSCAWW